MPKRVKVPADTTTLVLIEAGYRCAVPTCRTILAIDLHHMEEVSEGGGNEPSNLLPLCPTCHALHHRGEIPREAIYAWKSMLVSLSNAFDRDAIDMLLFLKKMGDECPVLTGDGILRFARLIAAGLVDFQRMGGHQVTRGEFSGGVAWVPHQTRPFLTEQGKMLVEAWSKGEREALRLALSPPPNG